MRKRQIPLIIVLLLVSACVNPAIEVIPPTQPEDTSTPLPPTETATPLPPTETSTPLPPTDTSTPLPTATIASTPTPDIPKERVEVAYEDRVIRGTLVGDGDIAVVLAPMFGENRSSWIAFAKHLALLGYTALAFDFPGFGSSKGEFNFDKTTDDVAVVIDHLYARGYERIVCMGASVGGGACYKAALLKPNLAGLVILSSPFETTAEDAATLKMPKLFISGDEPEVIPMMKDTYQILPVPKQFETLLVSSHGTNIFNTDSGDELRDLLVGFLETLK